MSDVTNRFVREATRKKDEPLNILTFVSHERYEPNLCMTGHNFYSLICDGTRTWNTKYADVPNNYIITQNEPYNHVRHNLDLVISHNPFVHLPIIYERFSHLPIINVMHTMPAPGWDSQRFKQQYPMFFEVPTKNVFISEFNLLAWDFDPNDSRNVVIHHCIDTDVFNPGKKVRNGHILAVANDYINRDWALGFNLWKEVTQGLPVQVVGKTPGLSEPAENTDELIDIYRSSQIFINTSLASPIPMALLEAMACGCAVVSTNTCMIPDIIEHGKDGFLCSPRKPDLFRKYLQELLEDKQKCNELGYNARKKIETMFNKKRFVEDWNNLFKCVL